MRNRARDYYDPWRVLRYYGGDLDLTGFRALLHEKCRLQDVEFDGPEDFFDPRMVANVEQGWRQSLGPLYRRLLHGVWVAAFIDEHEHGGFLHSVKSRTCERHRRGSS